MKLALRRSIIVTGFVTFLLPPFFIIGIDILAGLIDLSGIGQVFSSPALYIILIPIMIGMPVLINHRLKQISILIQNEEYQLLDKKRKNLLRLFVISSNLYGFTSLPIGFFSGYNPTENGGRYYCNYLFTSVECAADY